MHTAIPSPVPCKRAPWNKGRLIGQKRPLKPKDVWAIRVRLQLLGRKRDLGQAANQNGGKPASFRGWR